MRVLDLDGAPVADAQIRVVGHGSAKANERGYTTFYLADERWYALVVNWEAHEEILYTERLTPGRTYVYRPDPERSSGRMQATTLE